MSYRVVFGETMPAWENIFPTRREAREFAKVHRSYGDTIFSIKKVIPGEPAQSLCVATEMGDVEGFIARRKTKAKK